jgi:hypothetical protein
MSLDRVKKSVLWLEEEVSREEMENIYILFTQRDHSLSSIDETVGHCCDIFDFASLTTTYYWWIYFVSLWESKIQINLEN